MFVCMAMGLICNVAIADDWCSSISETEREKYTKHSNFPKSRFILCSFHSTSMYFHITIFMIYSYNFLLPCCKIFDYHKLVDKIRGYFDSFHLLSNNIDIYAKTHAVLMWYDYEYLLFLFKNQNRWTFQRSKHWISGSSHFVIHIGLTFNDPILNQSKWLFKPISEKV